MTDIASNKMYNFIERYKLADKYPFVMYFLAFMLPFLYEEQMNILMIIGIMLYLPVRRYYINKTFALEKNGILLALLMISLIYATIFSVSFTESLSAFLRFSNGILLMLIIQWVLVRKTQIIMFLQCLLIPSTLIGLYGIFQFFFKRTGTNLWLDTALHPDIEIRVTSLMQNPNNLAEYLVLIIPIAFAMILYKKHPFHKLLAIGISGIMVACLIVTYSRSGYLGFLLSLVLFVLVIEPKLFVVFPIALIGASIYMPAGLQSRIDSLSESILQFIQDPTTIVDTSIAYRVNIWQGVFRAYDDFLLFGAGLGNECFKLVYPFYQLSGIKADHAHSVFFEMIMELGIIGFVILGVFILNVVRQSLIATNTTDNKFIKYFSGACIVGILGLFITGLTEHVWYYHKVFYLFFGLLGVLMALYNNYRLNLWRDK